MHVKAKLEKDLGELVEKVNLSFLRGKVTVDYPENPAHGDYSTNIALRAQQVPQTAPFDAYDSPMKIAQKLIDKWKPDYLEKIEVVAPGFINFFLAKDFLLDNVAKVSKEADDFGRGKSLANLKIMVEFTDPNPFKEFHVGHLYSNAVGESLSRLFEAQGAEVWRVNYQGDIGLHVAKALWGMLSLKRPGLLRLEGKNLEERVKFMGEAYAKGTMAYTDDEKAKKEIDEINKKVYDKSDPEINNLYKKGRQWTLDYFETIYKRLGTMFKRYYFESEAGPIGLAFVKNHIKDGIFKESDGAIIFAGKKYGLHNRVFINSLGLPTYEAKDIGLAEAKYKDFEYNRSIIITAQEQSDYFVVVFKALSLINSDLAQKTMHIAHGVVRLPEGKMSSRTGNVITGEWLLDEAKRRIEAQYKEMDSKTAEQVAVGAVKYALLKSSVGQDIIFDFGKSISLEGDSGPYLQYTYARTQSVLNKSQMTKSSLRLQGDALEPEEMGVVRAIYHFPEVVEVATVKLAPNVLCHYLFSLSQTFNLFYEKQRIVGSDREMLRIALTAATGQVLKNGLSLLGIAAPSKM